MGETKKQGVDSIRDSFDSASILERVKIQKNGWENLKSWAGKSFCAYSFT